MRNLEGARGLLKILELRASLPRRVSATPLYVLLPSLTPTGPTAARDPEFEAWLLRVTEFFLRRHRPLRTTCLFRSLVRYSMLRDRGVPVRFVMGVQTGARELTGHAWLELDGEPFMEVLTHRYARTFEYPP
ncbi:MAG: lasso peptide biosynthesis B2 protein [Deltaproteobacteria bacterium]|nr:lasso peptide biosynthesis B2 protein [Deltaproteobacteria bacterium]